MISESNMTKEKETLQQKIKKMNENRDRIRYQLLLRFWMTQDIDIAFLLQRI
jgi:hypothetical protein